LPDGKHIVSGSLDRTIRIWDAETGQVVVGPLEGHNDLVMSVAFSPDGKRIVSGSYDQTIRVWDAEIRDVFVEPLQGHTEFVNSITFSPDDKHILSGPNGQTISTLSVLDNDPKTGFGDTSRLENGWILNSSSTLLFWVPSWNRVGLCWPRTSMVISRRDKSTQLDLCNFVCGDSWEQCKA
jgi:WD40 repeat protein